MLQFPRTAFMTPRGSQAAILSVQLRLSSGLHVTWRSSLYVFAFASPNWINGKANICRRGHLCWRCQHRRLCAPVTGKLLAGNGVPGQYPCCDRTLFLNSKSCSSCASFALNSNGLCTVVASFPDCRFLWRQCLIFPIFICSAPPPTTSTGSYTHEGFVFVQWIA